MRKAPTPTARGFTSDNGTLESYNLSEVIGPAQANSNSTDLDDDAIENPWAVDTRPLRAGDAFFIRPSTKAKLFRNASQELQALAEKHPPEIRLMIIDALQLMAADAGIGTDDPGSRRSHLVLQTRSRRLI